MELDAQVEDHARKRRRLILQGGQNRAVTAAREGLLPMPEDDALGLVPILVGGGGRNGGEPPAGGMLTLEVGGVRILVPVDFDPGHLGRVIAALRSAP